ncbi:MAG: hypothetical protein H0U97_07725 [Gammaproteobacteria bacterium]|nr:hypothetical protein [Gammaproteobacteria bacterium]
MRQRLATGGLTKRYRPPAQGKYTVADVALLAETDALHDTLSGPATQHLLQRVACVFGDTRTARLAKNGAVVRKCFGDSHPQRYAM